MAEMDVRGNPFDQIRYLDNTGEWWSARDLMPLLGYEQWRNFAEAIERARIAARNSGYDPELHFCRLQQKGDIGRSREDFRLTRFACYLIAINGDPNKSEIADAQSYFVIKAREAEVAIPRQREPELDLDDVGAQLAAIEAANDRAMKAVAIARQQFERANIAETKLGIAAPKADAWDALASAEGDYSVADAAAILCRDARISIGRDQLFDLMGQWGWVFRQKGDDRWRPYGEQVKAGRLGELPTYRNDATGKRIKNVPQVRVTSKGLKEIRERMTEQPPLFELGAS